MCKTSGATSLASSGLALGPDTVAGAFGEGGMRWKIVGWGRLNKKRGAPSQLQIGGKGRLARQCKV